MSKEIIEIEVLCGTSSNSISLTDFFQHFERQIDFTTCKMKESKNNLSCCYFTNKKEIQFSNETKTFRHRLAEGF